MPDDTNRRVAEACGIEVWLESLPARGTILMRKPDLPFDERGVRVTAIEFNPNKYPSDAVLAAETSGLFDGCGVRISRRDGKYEIIRWRHHFDGGQEELAKGDTFCEVICAAILKKTH